MKAYPENLKNEKAPREMLKTLVRNEIERGKVKKFFKEKDVKFIKACESAKIPPTKRQASKWLMHKGKAYKVYTGAL